MPAEMRRPLIVEIKRHSLNDGPGIRTAVFFKGCPLRCVFCHNPETQDAQPEILFAAGRCIATCSACRSACPRSALDLATPRRILRDKCDRCGLCVEACPSGALQLVGRYYSAEDLVEILLRDDSFYRHSGGGVTLTGGECTINLDYLEAVLRLLKERSVHVVLETCGAFDYEAFRHRVLPYLDLIYFDVKFADPVLHQRYTGSTNERILRNLAALLAQPVSVQTRVPLVPGITATEDNLRGVAERLLRMGAREVCLLPYNPLGLEMWDKLGKQRPAISTSFMPGYEEAAASACFANLLASGNKPKSHDRI